MSTFSYHVAISGLDFDPTLLPAGFSDAMTSLARRGDVSKRGAVSPEGHVSFEVASISNAVEVVRHLRASQPDEVQNAELVIGYWFDNQCNLEFSAAELSSLATERISLSISCYPRS